MRYFLLLLISACATTSTIYERGPTVQQILRPRAGYQDKLTNKRCAEKTKDVCTKYDVKEYDLNDPLVRKMLRELKFICNVRGERYVPCPTARGLCQLRIDKRPFHKSEIKLNKYISLHDDLDFLIGADTICASIQSEVGEQMFP